MGTFGGGNFDNDAALDILDAVRAVVDPEIDGFVQSDDAGVEDLEQVIACIAIKIALIEQCNLEPPSPEEARSLQDKILDIFDREIESLEPVDGYVEDRRKVIANSL